MRSHTHTLAHLANARLSAKSDTSIYALCTLQPHAFLTQSPESRHTLLRDAADLLCLLSTQELLRSEVLEGKSGTPNQNISYGTRFDKAFSAADASAGAITIPAQALAALQVGMALTVQISKTPQPVDTTPLRSVDVLTADTPT